jgi:hypothetical protein
VFIVLATNTNQDNHLYGPFDSKEDAQSAAHSMAGADHLHTYHVMVVIETATDEEE